MKYPKIKVKLTGTDGNAFIVLAKVRGALQQAKVSETEITEFSREAKAGDYDHLLATCMAWTDCR